MSPDSGNTLRYVTNGATGNNGACGANGNFGGYRGQDGAPGKCGQNAHALKVAIVSYNNIIFVQGNETSNELNISDRTVTISVEARGGDAGNGGNGGDGGKGVTGPKGKNATRYRWGQNGGQGGTGGNGGDGARGGDGGNGGKVTLTVAPSQTDLLMLFNTPDVRGGAHGRGGKGGYGGPGGDGGKGGESHHYVTTETCTDSSGRTQTRFKTHYQPGGSQGPHGLPGQDGRNAPDGRCGNAGSFHIAEGTRRYTGPYDLSVTASRLLLNQPGDDVFSNPANRSLLTCQSQIPVTCQHQIHNPSEWPS
ncbi:hypothetical protein [Endozoicomonas sp. GU-1]|uniref:hypothetical protein n=1 Tax=Endozoicomonas sp. GU-1 TaxID=3009078 RepID=UPI0022B484DB|nr:hypothetical protein [Endozoicomonas sp. GU-1]WBA86798.1 hypothetical protein O3276_01775 [Endozoicomonas sp. GU-1]